MEGAKRVWVYEAYGLFIQSELPLDGLREASAQADIQVKEGIVTYELPGLPNENSFAGGIGYFAFRVQDVGQFQITNGTEIVVDRLGDADPEIVTLYVLGTCMAALLLQRGMVPIHGSVLSIHGKPFIISGQSGAGKSTLTAYLYQQGFEFLADDVAALRVDNTGEVLVMPAYPKQKLWKDAADYMFGGVDGLERIPGIRDKYHIPIRERYVPTPGKLHALFELSTQPSEHVELHEVKGAAKLSLFIHNTFRLEMVDILGQREAHFRRCSTAVNQLRIFRLKRPEIGYTVEDQMRLIEGVMKIL